jgi:hypothetical protein
MTSSPSISSGQAGSQWGRLAPCELFALSLSSWQSLIS